MSKMIYRAHTKLEDAEDDFVAIQSDITKALYINNRLKNYSQKLQNVKQ
jgi:hypothetical protein